MMLMGRAPFAGNSPSEIFRNTCHGRLGLGRGGAGMWDKLPAAARELIVGLMQLDHNLRFTGEQAMSHRWLAMSPEEPGTAGVGRGAATSNERPRQPPPPLQQQQQQQASQNGGGSVARRRREGSRSGSRKGGKGGSGGSGGGNGKTSTAPSRGVLSGSSATSFATTPTSSSDSTPGRGGSGATSFSAGE